MPSNSIKLGDLMTTIRQRVDMTNSDFVGNDELVTYINLGLSELHDILVTAYEDYYIKDKPYALPADNGADLPEDFYKALGADITVGSSVYRMRPYSFAERAAYSSPATATARTNTFYNIRGNKLHFIPAVTQATSVTLFYIPEAGQFTKTDDEYVLTDTIETVAQAVPRGWEEYVILYAGIRCVLKEEGDPSGHYKLLEDIKKRLTEASIIRDPGESKGIRDVTIGTGMNDITQWM